MEGELISSTFVQIIVPVSINGTKPIYIIIEVMLISFSQLDGTHALSLVAVSTRVEHGVMPLTCSALVCCTGVCMPRIIEVLSVDTKVGDPGDHQL
jgi:hypothetical protein